MLDRGVQGTTGGPPVQAGTGPALYYAAAGYAGSSIDGPLGGLRNTTNANEDFTVFNVGNPAALRDNVRQSAAEYCHRAAWIPWREARKGSAEFFAALAAISKSKIRNIGQIEWGCENVQGRLLSLGAHIERVRE